MISNNYYPKKLIYLGDNQTEARKAILVSPAIHCEVTLDTIKLGEGAFADEYRQVAAACGAEFVDVNDIKIVSQDNRPIINNLRKSNA